MSKALVDPRMGPQMPRNATTVPISNEEEGRALVRESGQRAVMRLHGRLMDIGADGNDVIDVDATTVEVKPLSPGRRRVLLNGVWSAFELSLDGKPLRLDGIKAIDWTNSEEDPT